MNQIGAESQTTHRPEHRLAEDVLDNPCGLDNVQLGPSLRTEDVLTPGVQSDSGNKCRTENAPGALRDSRVYSDPKSWLLEVVSVEDVARDQNAK